ncbi:MAG TPA: hypothetical protein VNG51_01205 [Ktedonobacteraceae bacterium]|nr:hypothetical protein [Ktedonobacteraceae bacterium]
MPLLTASRERDNHKDIAQVEQVTSEDVMRVLHRFPLLDKQVLTALGPLDEDALSASA